MNAKQIFAQERSRRRACCGSSTVRTTRSWGATRWPNLSAWSCPKMRTSPMTYSPCVRPARHRRRIARARAHHDVSFAQHGGHRRYRGGARARRRRARGRRRGDRPSQAGDGVLRRGAFGGAKRGARRGRRVGVGVPRLEGAFHVHHRSGRCEGLRRCGQPGARFDLRGWNRHPRGGRARARGGALAVGRAYRRRGALRAVEFLARPRCAQAGDQRVPRRPCDSHAARRVVGRICARSSPTKCVVR